MSGDPRMCARVRKSLGVYVVGALDPAEAREVETHLAGCPGCADERDALAGVVLHMAGLSAEEVERGPVEAGPEMLARLSARVAAERRAARRRRLLMGAAAVTVLVGGMGWAAAVVASDDDGGPARAVVSPTATAPQAGAPSTGPAATPPPSDGAPGHGEGHVVAATDVDTGVRAEVGMEEVGWGTRLTVALAGVPEGARCRLDAVGPDGARETAASWQATYHGAAHVDGGVAFAPEDIRRFEVVTLDGVHLVTVRP